MVLQLLLTAGRWLDPVADPEVDQDCSVEPLQDFGLSKLEVLQLINLTPTRLVEVGTVRFHHRLMQRF